MNRNAFIALKFLIWIIIAILFFGGFIGCTSKYIYLNFKPDPYSELISFIEQVNSDKSVKFDYKIITLKENKGLIGFSENTEKLDYLEGGKVLYSIDVPESCNKKSCLCICEDFLFKIWDQGSLIENRFVNCNEQLKCHVFEKINFTNSVYTDASKSKILKGGFLISGSYSGDPGKPKGASRAVYIKRFDNTLSVCDTSECSEIKAQPVII